MPRRPRIILEYSFEQGLPVAANAPLAHPKARRSGGVAAVMLESRIFGLSMIAQVQREGEFRARAPPARRCMRPGVWPIRKNRASRLLSASNALTGKVSWLRPPGWTT